MAPLLLFLLVIGTHTLCTAPERVPCSHTKPRWDYCLDRSRYYAECNGSIGTEHPKEAGTNTRQLETQTNLIPLVGSACATPAIAAACLSQFRACASDDLPRPVCPSVCDNFIGNCSTNALIKLSQLPNCSMSDRVIPSELFYEDSRPNIYSNETVLCVSPASGSPDSVGCGAVQFPFAPDENGDCRLLCPSPTLNKPAQWQRMHLMYRIIAPICLACQIFLGVPWLFKFKLRNPFYPLFFLMSAMIITLGYIFSVVTNYRTWLCIDKFTVRTQYNSAACWFQGALIHYGVVSAAASITVILYHLLTTLKQGEYLIFGRGKFIPIRPLWAYLAFIVGYPTIFVIAGYSASNGMICLVDGVPGNRWPMDGVFFFPILVLFILDLIMVGILSVYIFKLGGLRALRSQVRLFALCIYYMFVIGYGEGYLIYNRATINELKSDIKKYVLCVLGAPDDHGRYYPVPAGSTKSCESYWVDPPPEYWSRWFSQVIGLTTGIALLVIFYHAELLVAWRSLLTGAWGRLGGSFASAHSNSPNPSTTPPLSVSSKEASGGPPSGPPSMHDVRESRF